MMIRTIQPTDYGYLEDFLYLAIYVPEGVPAPDKSLLQLPELQLYIKDFGQKETDIGLLAEEEGRVVAMAWLRSIKDYGYIDDQTLSLSISVLPDYRGRGLGGQLMLALFEQAKAQAWTRLSLSVSKENPAVRFYQRLGFQVYEDKGQELIMLKILD